MFHLESVDADERIVYQMPDGRLVSLLPSQILHKQQPNQQSMALHAMGFGQISPQVLSQQMPIKKTMVQTPKLLDTYKTPALNRGVKIMEVAENPTFTDAVVSSTTPPATSISSSNVQSVTRGLKRPKKDRDGHTILKKNRRGYCSNKPATETAVSKTTTENYASETNTIPVQALPTESPRTIKKQIRLSFMRNVGSCLGNQIWSNFESLLLNHLAERNLQASSRDEKVLLRKELWQMKTAVERSMNELVGMMLDSEYGCLDNSLVNALGNKSKKFARTRKVGRWE